MTIIYLSKEWENQEWESFEAEIVGGDESDCGWGPDGPCGGCARCMRAQFSYYIEKEKTAGRIMREAGRNPVDPRWVTIGYYPGFGGYHDSYNCRMAEERDGWFYPWEKSSK